MASPTDVRLVSQVELIAQKSEYHGAIRPDIALTLVSANLRDLVAAQWPGQP